jgi:hypothetical protein
MGFRELQVTTGMGSPKLAQEAGPIGGGAITEPMGEEREKWLKEVERKQKGESYKSGGKISSASSRADGCATKGKTRGKMI